MGELTIPMLFRKNTKFPLSLPNVTVLPDRQGDIRYGCIYFQLKLQYKTETSKWRELAFRVRQCPKTALLRYDPAIQQGHKF